MRIVRIESREERKSRVESREFCARVVRNESREVCARVEICKFKLDNKYLLLIYKLFIIENKRFYHK